MSCVRTGLMCWEGQAARRVLLLLHISDVCCLAGRVNTVSNNVDVLSPTCCVMMQWTIVDKVLIKLAEPTEKKDHQTCWRNGSNTATWIREFDVLWDWMGYWPPAPARLPVFSPHRRRSLSSRRKLLSRLSSQLRKYYPNLKNPPNITYFREKILILFS